MGKYSLSSRNTNAHVDLIRESSQRICPKSQKITQAFLHRLRSKFDETMRMPKRIIAPPNHTFGPGSSPQKMIAINTAKMGVKR